jgi:hypothetical protein
MEHHPLEHWSVRVPGQVQYTTLLPIPFYHFPDGAEKGEEASGSGSREGKMGGREAAEEDGGGEQGDVAAKGNNLHEGYVCAPCTCLASATSCHFNAIL